MYTVALLMFLSRKNIQRRFGNAASAPVDLVRDQRDSQNYDNGQ